MISLTNFSNALPSARAIQVRYALSYSDHHSHRLSRWIAKAERTLVRTVYSSDAQKQKIVDCLIHKLVTEILVSPYDRAPFIPGTEKAPLLFKGLLFPSWLLEDIFELIGSTEGSRAAKPHAFINEMIGWVKSLNFHPSSSSFESTAIVVAAQKDLVFSGQSSSNSYLDRQTLVALNASGRSELVMIKLAAYRDFLKSAWEEIRFREVKWEAKRELKQVVTFQEDQKQLLEKDKIRRIEGQFGYEQSVADRFEGIDQIQQSTYLILHGHSQALMEQMAETEEKIRRLKLDNANKETQIASLITAQQHLRV